MHAISGRSRAAPAVRAFSKFLLVAGLIGARETIGQQVVFVSGTVEPRGMRGGARLQPGTVIAPGHRGIVLLAYSWRVGNEDEFGGKTYCERWVIVGGTHRPDVAPWRYPVRDEVTPNRCSVSPAHVRLPTGGTPGMPFVTKVTFKSYQNDRADVVAPPILVRLRRMIDSIKTAEARRVADSTRVADARRAADSARVADSIKAAVADSAGRRASLRNVSQDLRISFSSTNQGQDSGSVVGSVVNSSINSYACVRLEFRLYAPPDERRPEMASRVLGSLTTNVWRITPRSVARFQERLPYAAGIGLSSVSECR